MDVAFCVFVGGNLLLRKMTRKTDLKKINEKIISERGQSPLFTENNARQELFSPYLPPLYLFVVKFSKYIRKRTTGKKKRSERKNMS